MSIEQIVQQAIDEFGELAHERFTRRYAPHFSDTQCQLQNNSDFSDYDLQDTHLKPLPELFAHDVKVYGDDAYLMWDIDTQWVLKFNFSFNCNFTVECALTDGRSLVKRKASAYLPFCLDRAKAGDVVEWFNGNKWVLLALKFCSNHFILNNELMYRSLNGASDNICLCDLRMKYQRRLK